MKGRGEWDEEKEETVWDLKGLEWRKQQFEEFVRGMEFTEKEREALKSNWHIPNEWIQ